MWCFPAKTCSLIHDEPHPNRCNKGWKCFYFVAFNSVRMTEFLAPLYLCFPGSLFMTFSLFVVSHAFLSACSFSTGMLWWNASQPVWVRTHHSTISCEDWSQYANCNNSCFVKYTSVLFIHYTCRFLLWLFRTVNSCFLNLAASLWL